MLSYEDAAKIVDSEHVGEKIGLALQAFGAGYEDHDVAQYQTESKIVQMKSRINRLKDLLLKKNTVFSWSYACRGCLR